MLVQRFLEDSARQYPAKTALVCGGQRLTYQEIEAAANRLAHALQALGLQRGDRVVIFLDNSPEVAISIFAALKAGGVFVIVNPTAKIDKLAYILNNCRARVVITQASKVRPLTEEQPPLPHLSAIVVARGEIEAPPGSIPCLTLDGLLAPHEADTSRPDNSCVDVDLAALIYTSGSTGNPKGVMLTHLNMVAAATSITTYLENQPDDIILNVLPLSFDYGLYQLLMAFKIGGTLVLERSFAYPYAVIETLRRENVTGFPLVPTILAILLQLDLSKFSFPALRYVSNTGAALPTPHIARLRQLFPHVRIYSMYGLTECKRVAYLPPDQIDRRPNSVGKAMPNVEAYVVDEHGRVPPGTIGELVVRGSNVMKGYWEMPEATSKMLQPDPVSGETVLYTGDQFWMDEEGYLYFVGRTDNIIKTRGEKVSPKEVENVLYALESVAEAVVIGVPDPVLGQAIKAVVALKAGAQLTAQDIQRHCARHRDVERAQAGPQRNPQRHGRRRAYMGGNAGAFAP